MAKYTLAYFDVQDAVAPIRMVLHHADIQYNYHVFTRTSDEWAKKKPETPYGHLPVLKIGDEKYGETIPILRYLGEKYDLAADTPEKRLYADSMVEAVKDLLMEIVKPMFTMKPEEREPYFKEKVKEMPTLFDFVEKQMGRNNHGGYLAGKLTWQDCQIVSTWECLIHAMGKEIFANLPNMKKHYDTVSAHPSIKSYWEFTKDIPMYPKD